MITLSNLRVTFAPGTVMEKKALQGINLKIAEGEFITVIGSNGAGKSTLLHGIAGEIPSTQGAIHIGAKDVTHLPAHHRADLVARVFQDPLGGTCADLTIAENMALAHRRGQSRALAKAVSRGDRAFYGETLKALGLGLEKRLDTSMSLLSGGQRQAVSLMMATLSPFKILLLDEHTAALDPRTAVFVMKLTENIIREKGLTALMVTHSLHQALHSGTRTIMLHEGKLIYDVAGEARAALTVADLLRQFGNAVDDDRLLLES